MAAKPASQPASHCCVIRLCRDTWPLPVLGMSRASWLAGRLTNTTDGFLTGPFVEMQDD